MKVLFEYYDIEPTEEYTQEDLDNFNKTHDLGQFEKEEPMIDAETAQALVVQDDKDNNKKKKKDDDR